MSLSIPAETYPTAAASSDAWRWAHSRLRRRLLYGRHEQDIQQRIQSAIGTVRRDAWGEIDLTSNPFLHTWSQLAALYRQAPQVAPPPGGEDVAAAMAAAGYWTLMPRLQRDTLGLREMLVYVDISPGGEPTYQPIFPDLVEVLAVDPWQPARPVALKVWRRDPADASSWLAYLYDARGDGRYQVLDKAGHDVSGRALRPAGESELGAYVGDAYPWRVAGRPVLPFVTYHAEDTGSVWDPYTGREVVEGSLQLGVLYTYYNHIIRNAAWGQRYVVGAQPVGAATAPTGQRAEVVTDPATLLVLEPMDIDGAGQVLVGQWNSPVDPEKILNSIIRYERRLVEMAVGAAEVTRAESDIRSGYSLAVSREAQEKAQGAYKPLFRRADLEVIRLTAGLMGGPADGWTITYPEFPDEVIGGAGGPDIQKTALNGAQVEAAKGIVVEVASGALPRDAGLGMLQRFFQLSPEEAEAVMASVGQGFQATPPMKP